MAPTYYDYTYYDSCLLWLLLTMTTLTMTPAYCGSSVLPQNGGLTKETLQYFLAACGTEGSREAAEAADKYGNVPLRHLVTSSAFTDQHLRVMLRTNDRAVQVKDRHGNPPLHPLTPPLHRRAGQGSARQPAATPPYPSTTSPYRSRIGTATRR